MTLRQAIANLEQKIPHLECGEAMECLQLKRWLEELLAYRVKSGLYTKDGAPCGETSQTAKDDVHRCMNLGELLDFISKFPREALVCGVHDTYPMPLDVWECCEQLWFE